MAPDQSTAIFLNEGAGGGRTDRVRRAVDLTRRALDADLHVIETRDVDELSSWLGERLERYATGVMVGGDGSLATAYNVAAGRQDLTLGWIPAGFGNATAHLLNMPSDPEGVAEVLARRDARPIDLVAVGDRLALFAGAGWDALVAGRYADGRRPPSAWLGNRHRLVRPRPVAPSGRRGRRGWLDGASWASRDGRRQHDAVLRSGPAGQPGRPN